MDISIFIFIVLKYVVYTIITILSFLLFLLLILLFVPIKYCINISKDEEFNMTARITWICSIIKILFIQNKNESKTIVTIFGINADKFQRMFNREIKTKEIKNDVNIKKHVEKKSSDDNINLSGVDNEYHEHETEPEVMTKYKKIVQIIKKYLKHVELLKKYEGKKEIFDLSIDLIKRLVRALNINIYKLKAEVGLGEKHKTGQLLGLCAVVFGLLCLDINLKGNFEQKILRISTEIKGKILLYIIIYHFVIYIFKKPVWRIIRSFLRKDDISEQY